MAVRTALLTSRNINLDTDFSKYIETVSEPGVITGLAVTASAVGTGQAWVPCERTNGETIYAFVQNFNSVAISGDGYVIISIPQNIVDNGGGNEDGTGIATIEVVNELPAKNYLQLATISSGTVTDTRNMIPTVWELKTDVNSLFASVEDLDTRVDALEAAGAIDHLEERALVWENYALTNTLFKQITPKLADSTVEANVWDVAANTEVHIQRLGSGTASDELKLKMKMAGSPTTSVVVEVREGTKVDVSSSEAYWYGNSSKILATGTLTSSSFSNDWQEVTFALDNEVGGTEGQLLDIVVYQTTGSGATVNSTNYYVLACDSTQRSEGFSFVSVNWSTRSRSKLMPYCISDGFAQFMLAKVAGLFEAQKTYYNSSISQSGTSWQSQTLYSFTVDKDMPLHITLAYTSGSAQFYVNTTGNAGAGTDDNGTSITVTSSVKNYSWTLTVTAWTTIYLRMYTSGSTTGNGSASIIGVLNSLYKNNILPFWLPYKKENISNTTNIKTYWIVKTSYLNTKIFLNSNLAITTSNSNYKSYLWETDDQGNILFTWLEFKETRLPATARTQIINTGNVKATINYTIEKDWFITYSIKGSSTENSAIRVNGLLIYSAGTTTFFGSIPVVKWDVIQVATGTPNSNYGVEGVVYLFA